MGTLSGLATTIVKTRICRKRKMVRSAAAYRNPTLHRLLTKNRND